MYRKEGLKTTNVELNDKNTEILTRILKSGFMFVPEYRQPKTIDDVVNILLEIADQEGFIHLETEY